MFPGMGRTTLNRNVGANMVSPSNDFSNLNPRRISFRGGGVITGVIGVLMMPWKLLNDFSTYVFGLAGGLLGAAELARRGVAGRWNRHGFTGIGGAAFAVFI